MAIIKISVVNASTVVTDDAVQAALAGIQTQVHEDYAPAWGIDADLSFIPQGSNPPAGSWWMTILDTSDQAGALGYHDLTPEGLPAGKVFAKSDLDANLSWTTTFSHEVLEMLGDPDVNLWAFHQFDPNTVYAYAYEMCDACEADQLGYKIGEILVSDFVYPPYFEEFRAPGSTQFDHTKHIQQPFQILQGGYSLVMDVALGQMKQIYGATTLRSFAMRPRVGSRRERRIVPKTEWLRSVPRAAARSPKAPKGSKR